MNFQGLFTTARVVTAVYRVASTTLLLIYLAQRVSDGRKFSRGRRATAGRLNSLSNFPDPPDRE